MKTTLKFAACAALAALALAGCRASTYERTEITEGYVVKFSDMEYAYVSVWTDPETGCQSYVTDDGFISPRLTADGMQRCVTSSVGAVAPFPEAQG